VTKTPTTHGAGQEFAEACRMLAGRSVSHVWRGHGSAVFLEFGALHPTKLRNGKLGHPEGEFGLMIESSWRIEDAASIICGSWSDEELWEPALERLCGAEVTEVQLFGRLPEIAVSLSNDLHVLSFATAEGQPEWTLFDRRGRSSRAFGSASGTIALETPAAAGNAGATNGPEKMVGPG
jgi:hypothetical protein